MIVLGAVLVSWLAGSVTLAAALCRAAAHEAPVPPVVGRPAVHPTRHRAA